MDEANSLLVDKLASDLRARIASGEYGTSGTLPSTTKLAKEWGKPRSVVTDVMLLLRSEGLIRVAGNRYAVNHPILILPGLTKDFEQYLQSQGLKSVIKNLIEPTLEEMPKDIAPIFGQKPGIRVVHRMRLQGTPDQWLRVGEIWYPAELAEPFLESMKRNDQMNVVNAIKEKFGVFIVRVKEDILARIPHKEEIKWLDLARYQTVFEVRRTSLAQDGRAVMLTRTIMVATNFILSHEYEVDHWKEDK